MYNHQSGHYHKIQVQHFSRDRRACLLLKNPCLPPEVPHFCQQFLKCIFINFQYPRAITRLLISNFIYHKLSNVFGVAHENLKISVSYEEFKFV